MMGALLSYRFHTATCAGRLVTYVLAAEDLDVSVELIEAGAVCVAEEFSPLTESTCPQLLDVSVIAVHYVPSTARTGQRTSDRRADIDRHSTNQ
jgi:hypothetical protein